MSQPCPPTRSPNDAAFHLMTKNTIKPPAKPAARSAGKVLGSKAPRRTRAGGATATASSTAPTIANVTGKVGAGTSSPATTAATLNPRPIIPVMTAATATVAAAAIPALTAAGTGAQLSQLNLNALSKTDIAALRRLGNDTLVTVDGVTGVFTPVTSKDGTPVTADERKNLLAIIDQLKQEVATKQDNILRLNQELTTLREMPSSAPEDFATAVQQSLDELQQRMANMRNGISNFAVRDFKLDASVFVQVTPMGSVQYRFIQPGENIEAAAVSRLSLNVVPIPKSDARGVWTSNLFQPELPISALPEVDATMAARLEKAGIYSVGEFVQVATRARAQVQLEALLDVQRDRLTLWAQQAALMTLRGVDGKVATVLIKAGLGSFELLAANTSELVFKLYETTRAGLPDLGAAEIEVALAAQWIRAARQYLGLPELPATPPEPA